MSRMYFECIRIQQQNKNNYTIIIICTKMYSTLKIQPLLLLLSPVVTITSVITLLGEYFVPLLFPVDKKTNNFNVCLFFSLLCFFKKISMYTQFLLKCYKQDLVFCIINCNLPILYFLFTLFVALYFYHYRVLIYTEIYDNIQHSPQLSYILIM